MGGSFSKVRAIAVVTLIVSIVALQSGGGPVEIGWAVALSMGVFYLCMSFAAWMTLRHLRKAETEA